jgi:hypothetical protein
LVLDVQHSRPHGQQFAASVFTYGLSCWLQKLHRLKSLDLISDGSKQVNVGSLPSQVERLSLVGLSLLYSGKGGVWEVLKPFPLRSLYLSTTDPEDKRARDRKRARETLRDAVVVLCEYVS